MTGIQKQLHQCRRIEQPQVHTLPRQRMHHVRGVTYQSYPLRYVVMSGKAPQRK